MQKGTFSGNLRKNDLNLQRGPNNIPGLEPSFSGKIDHARMSTVIKHPFADRNKYQNNNFSPSSRTSSEPMSEFYGSEQELPTLMNIAHPSPMACYIPRPSSMPWKAPYNPSHSTPQLNRPRPSQTVQNIPYTLPITFDPYYEAQMNATTSPYKQSMVQEYFHSIRPSSTRAPSQPLDHAALMQHQTNSNVQFGCGKDARFSPYPQHHREQTFVMHSTKANFSSLSCDGATAKSGKVSASPKTNKNNGEQQLVVNNHRFFVGTIEQVVRWYKTAKQANLYIIYKTAGVLETMTRGGRWGEYVIVLRDHREPEEREEGGDRGGPSPLQLVFHPIDRDLPPGVVTGQLVTCVGRMSGENKMQVLDIEPATRESLVGLKRISFLCQWAMQEAAAAANEP